MMGVRVGLWGRGVSVGNAVALGTAVGAVVSVATTPGAGVRVAGAAVAIVTTVTTITMGVGGSAVRLQAANKTTANPLASHLE